MSSNEWKEYRVGEICNLITGFPFKSQEYLDDGKYRVIRGDNVKSGFIYWKEKARYWNEFSDKFKKYILKEYDLVIGMDGSRVGKNRAIIGKTDLPSLLAQRVACIRTNDDFDQGYISYVIFSDKFEKYVESIKTGTSIPHISLKQISDFTFRAPLLLEQRKISNILFSIDKKIKLNNKLNQNLQSISQLLFKHWFVDFEFPNVEGLPYKSSGGEMIDSELGMIPKGWKVGKINDIADVTDYVANGSFASLKENVHYIGNDIGYAVLIRLVDYNNNFCEPFMWVDENGYNFLRKSKLFGGEIIISNVGANAGTVFKAPKLNKPMTLGPNSIMIGINNYNNYLYYYLCGHIGQENLNSIKTGSAQPKFNKTDFRNIRLVIPSKTNINRFNILVGPIIQKIERIDLEIKNLISIRDTLLPKLMSGEIDVSNIKLNQ